MMAKIELAVQTLEEKVLLYLNEIWPSHQITSVNAAMVSLHCSRRQLQRVLKKLCDEGVLEKNGRGSYRRGCGRFLGPELSNSKTASILHRTQTP